MPKSGEYNTEAEGALRGSNTVCVAAAGFALVACVLAVWVRAHHSRVVLFENWDARVYTGMASGLDAALHRSIGEGWAFLRASLRSTHNALYAVPIVAGYRFLGDSWESYEILVAVLYALPACCVVGLLGSAIAARRRGQALLLVLTMALTLPTVWESILSYYPDVAALVALGGLMWMGWSGREKLEVKALAGMAFCGAWAVLLRRHFAFPVLSAYLAIGLTHAFATHAATVSVAPVRRLAEAGLRLGASAVAGLGLMFLVAPRYSSQFFGNYSALYEGWRHPLGELALRFLGESGLGTTALALAGLWLAEWRGLAQRGASLFMGVFAVGWCILWWFGSGQAGLQYDLHVFPLIQAVGLGLGAVALLESARKTQRALGGGVALVATVRFLLAPWEPPSSNAVRYAIGPNLAPNRTHAYDVDSYRSLIQMLRSLAPPGKAIYVAAGSHLLSDAILKSVEEYFPVPGRPRLTFLEAAQVDSRDALPIADLTRADVIVSATPVQYHLAPQNQRLVGTVVRMMSDDQPFASAFGLRGTVEFLSGFRADVYVRKRATDFREAVQLLDAMLEEMKTPPGGQGPWALVSSAAEHSGGQLSPTSCWLSVEPLGDASPRLVSVKRYSGRPLVEAKLRVSRCPGGVAKIACVHRDGSETNVGAFVVPATGPDQYASFRTEARPVEDCRLSLTVDGSSPDGPACEIYFRALSVEAGENQTRP